MAEPIVIETLSGEATSKAIPALARLRVTVFRHFPYLYEGDLVYEQKYLSKYIDLPDSTIVVARRGPDIVGASTALPLARAGVDEQRPFRAAGIDLDEVYYFGDSVLPWASTRCSRCVNASARSTGCSVISPVRSPAFSRRPVRSGRASTSP